MGPHSFVGFFNAGNLHILQQECFATEIAHFGKLFEKRGPFTQKGDLKGSPFQPKGLQRGPGSPEGDPIGGTATNR